jgi:hypothetical protein
MARVGVKRSAVCGGQTTRSNSSMFYLTHLRLRERAERHDRDKDD